MRARVKAKTRVIRRGHRVSVAKRRAGRNAGGSGEARLRGRDGKARCSA